MPIQLLRCCWNRKDILIMRIGVIGATGHVGAGALRALEKENHDVTAFYYTPEKAELLKKQFPGKIRYEYLDVQDELLLSETCEKCDILINCAGPSSKLQDSIAICCVRAGKMYIDVAGGKNLRHKTEDDCSMYPGGSVILGAGIYPGLTEIAGAAIAEKTASLKKLKIFFHGNSTLSYAAAYDIVSGMEESGDGMSYLKNGIITRISGDDKETKPVPFDQLVTIPVLGDEYVEMAKKKGVPEAYFYHSFSDDKAMMDFIMIKALKQYETEDGKRKAAEKVQKLLYRPDEAREVIIAARYTYADPTEETGNFCMKSHEDWSLITGYIAGLTALELADKSSALQGVHYVSEVTNPARMVERLRDLCDIDISMNGKAESE